VRPVGPQAERDEEVRSLPSDPSTTPAVSPSRAAIFRDDAHVSDLLNSDSELLDLLAEDLTQGQGG
jgi:hypothetical protein